MQPQLAFEEIARMIVTDTEVGDAGLFMRAFLAIARLDQIIPSYVESVATDNFDDFRLRNVINTIGYCFGDADVRNVWSNHDPARLEQMLFSLKVLNGRALISGGESVPNEVSPYVARHPPC